MKKDTEVKLLMQERRKGIPQRLAAARAGMGERTAYSHQLKAHSTASCSSNWAELGCFLRLFI
jgi:hypothetical protein